MRELVWRMCFQDADEADADGDGEGRNGESEGCGGGGDCCCCWAPWRGRGEGAATAGERGENTCPPGITTVCVRYGNELCLRADSAPALMLILCSISLDTDAPRSRDETTDDVPLSLLTVWALRTYSDSLSEPEGSAPPTPNAWKRREEERNKTKRNRRNGEEATIWCMMIQNHICCLKALGSLSEDKNESFLPVLAKSSEVREEERLTDRHSCAKHIDRRPMASSEMGHAALQCIALLLQFGEALEPPFGKDDDTQSGKNKKRDPNMFWMRGEEENNKNNKNNKQQRKRRWRQKGLSKVLQSWCNSGKRSSHHLGRMMTQSRKNKKRDPNMF